MAISFFFSLNLYRISAQEIDYSLTRQQMMFERGGRLLPPTDNSAIVDTHAAQLADEQQRIIWQLVYTNIFIFILAGGISYMLARLTLQPIEKAHEEQTRFTADASHELRSPLAVMKSEIEVTLRDPNLTKEDAVQILKSNLEEVDRLKTLAEGLLELANGKDEFIFEKVSLNEAVQGAVSNVTKQIKSSKAKISVDIPDNLMAHANKDSIKELFTILLDNAIKYSKEAPIVAVSAKRDGKLVEITVKDNGIGIDEKSLPHIFERFYRSEPSRSKNDVEGYGLGLSIAEKIVHKNNGRIEASNNPSGGTIFKVFLSLS